jgi:hypothetical protein
MENLLSLTIFAIGLAALTSFPAGAAAAAVAAAVAVLALTLTMVSGAVLGLARLPIERD